jgi:hypothetical protein
MYICPSQEVSDQVVISTDGGQQPQPHLLVCGCQAAGNGRERQVALVSALWLLTGSGTATCQLADRTPCQMLSRCNHITQGCQCGHPQSSEHSRYPGGATTISRMSVRTFPILGSVTLRRPITVPAVGKSMEACTDPCKSTWAFTASVLEGLPGHIWLAQGYAGLMVLQTATQGNETKLVQAAGQLLCGGCE